MIRRNTGKTECTAMSSVAGHAVFSIMAIAESPMSTIIHHTTVPIAATNGKAGMVGIERIRR